MIIEDKNNRKMGHVTVFSDVPDEVEEFQAGGKFEHCRTISTEN